MAGSKRTRLRDLMDPDSVLLVSCSCTICASRLPRCLHGIGPFPKSIGLAPEMALRCRTRRQESGHVSRSVLRTGRKLTLHPFKGTAKIPWYLDRYQGKHRTFANPVSAQVPQKHGLEVTMVEVQTMRDRPKEKL